MCRCPATPAPAALPRFSPKLIPSGRVHLAQNSFGTLRQHHDLLRRSPVQAGQGLLVGKGHNHDVPGRVRKSVENDEAMLRPQHNIGRAIGVYSRASLFDREPGGRDQVTKDAVTVTGPGSQRLGYALARASIGIDQVGVAPRRPQIVHAVQVYGAYAAAHRGPLHTRSSVSSPAALQINKNRHFQHLPAISLSLH